MYQPHVAVKHHQMATKFFQSPMGYVNSQRPKKFGGHFSSFKVIEKNLVTN
jgi:hypothetical protein